MVVSLYVPVKQRPGYQDQPVGGLWQAASVNGGLLWGKLRFKCRTNGLVSGTGAWDTDPEESCAKALSWSFYEMRLGSIM